MAAVASETAAIIDLTSSDDCSPTQEEEEEAPPSLLLGSFQCAIVGIRYYTGVAHPGEYVQLIREPTNPYDKNAIRVDNMAGVKVGHIKATVAVALAPVMDTLTARVKIDGTIPSKGNEYTLPLKIELFGESAADQASVDSILRRHRQPWSPNRALVRPDLPADLPPQAVEVAKQTVDWKMAQQGLDDMFEKISKDQLANLPDIQMPAALTATLLDHQVEGIRWLYQRETDTKEAPFYRQVKEHGKTVWLSEITNSSQPDAPAPVRGSILADDMGLGKSLQAIALILANPPKNPKDPKVTLIVCPVSVMSNWMQQIEQHLAPNTLKVGLYHGADRRTLVSAEADFDVLVASYGTLSTDYGSAFPKEFGKQNSGNTGPPKKKKPRKSTGPSIFEHAFHRIILDEAHTIRNTKSRTFSGCAALKATYRLCLTGTPLQNKPEDIHSLFSFLAVEPLGDRDIFRRAISQPIQNGEDVGLARLRTMMAHMALRRNKSKLELVEKTVELRSVAFPADSPHKKIHDALFESARMVFRATLSSGDDKLMKNYMQILETLMRIRQACVSGNLVPRDRIQAAEQVLVLVKGKEGTLTADEADKLLEKLKGAFLSAAECAICLEDMEENAAVILRACSHVFCEPCLSKVSEQCRGFCPLCRHKFEPQDMIKQSAAAAAAHASDGGEKPKTLAETAGSLGPSPKIEALGLAIGEMKDDEKAVIFSQFTMMLDLLEPFLAAQGHSFVRIDGSKSATQRIAAIQKFSADGGPRFILCSLHAAGTGISLTRGNHCYMMDTWWNSSVEQQAMDRIHRIGQTRPVRVIRFVMKDSIEERMIALQEAKAALGKGSMEKLKPEEVRKARLGYLKSLFSIK